MRACVMVEPQMGMSYEELLHVARLALECGLEGTFRSDHYDRARDDRPVLDAWATLAGLVRDLDRGVVGTLVSPVGFRHPGELAKVVQTVAHMSRGVKVELGLGTGWNKREHEMFGFPFGTFGDRFSILEEYLPVVRGIMQGDEFSFDGRHYTLEACASRPPAPDVRIVVGGTGPKRTPRLAAQYGDELNLVMAPPAVVAERIATCRRHLERLGRDPAAFAFSWMGQFLIGADKEDVERRAAAAGRAFGASAEQLLQNMRGRIPIGTVDEAAEFLRGLKDLGVSRVMLQHLGIADDDHLRLGAEAAAAA